MGAATTTSPPSPATLYAKVIYWKHFSLQQRSFAHSSSTQIYSKWFHYLSPPVKLPFFFKSIFTIYSQHSLGTNGFGPRWIAKTTNFGNMSSYIRETWPSHLNFSFIIALESGMTPHFSYSLLFYIRSVKYTSGFQSTDVSEPNKTTVATVTSSTPKLVHRLIFLFFKLF